MGKLLMAFASCMITSLSHRFNSYKPCHKGIRHSIRLCPGSNNPILIPLCMYLSVCVGNKWASIHIAIKSTPRLDNLLHKIHSGIVSGRTVNTAIHVVEHQRLSNQFCVYTWPFFLRRYALSVNNVFQYFVPLLTSKTITQWSPGHFSTARDMESHLPQWLHPLVDARLGTKHSWCKSYRFARYRICCSYLFGCNRNFILMPQILAFVKMVVYLKRVVFRIAKGIQVATYLSLYYSLRSWVLQIVRLLSGTNSSPQVMLLSFILPCLLLRTITKLRRMRGGVF